MDTTLNIRMDLLKQIEKAARSFHVSRSEIIFFLIKRAVKDIPDSGRIGRLVRYQERARPEDWHTFHIRVREDMYEYWLDLKKLTKMSVSHALADAVKRYLSKQMRVYTTDNYLCKNYIIIKEIIDYTVIWKLVWGFPPDPSKLFYD